MSWTNTRIKLDQRGSASVELTLIVPALVLMLGLIVAGGRVWFARTTVNEAAHSAARAASLAGSAAEAATVGRSAGNHSLSTGGLRCSSSSVTVNVGAFGVPVGTPGTITAAARCRVAFADLLLRGLPGSIELTAAGASALDTYRSR
jgi:Flp pilus assembly protein TadG